MKTIDIKPLEKNLGVKFTNIDNLAAALVHRSYLNEDSKIKSSNERLEFLGDSVLSLVVSTYLYREFPSYPEGQLTSTRSILVQSKTLARLSQSLGIGDYLLMSKGEEMSGGRNNVSILADTFEAIIGAIFLDRGFDEVSKFISEHLIKKITELLEVVEVRDYKSKLQELIQETKRVSPQYTVTKSEGPDHAKKFFVQVSAADETLSEGVGKSKQEAEQDAARVALEKLEK